jgi:predicted O-methyltransferase YrrM
MPTDRLAGENGDDVTLFERILRRIHPSPRRAMSHGDLITRLIDDHAGRFHQPAVLVETGCGLSTVALARAARRLEAVAYSCDYNQEKIAELQRRSSDTADVVFRAGDSQESLRAIVADHAYLDLVFLDSAASAMHTWREFLIVEPRLQPGAVLLVDNAALPGARRLLSPVRKGKILVHYLLASPVWEVEGFPAAGDSMVGAYRHAEPDYADPRYEDPDYVDHWRATLGV